VTRCALKEICRSALAECQGGDNGGWLGLLPPDEAASIEHQIMQQLVLQDDFHLRMQVRQGDTFALLVLHGMVAERDADNQPLRIIGLSRREASVDDPEAAQAEFVSSALEEKRRLETILMNAQRFADITHIAGSVAHDLNNLLSPIRMSVELLRRKLDDASLDRYVEIIEDSTSRARSVVKQLLSFAKDTDRGAIEPVDVNAVLEELRKLVETTFPKGIKATFTLEPQLPQPLMNPGQLHQALLNILINARDAMQGKGNLDVTSSLSQVQLRVTVGDRHLEPGSYVRISIRDNGCGMPPDVQERIFDPFFTTKGRDSGTGLGLASVYGIIASCGGFIDLESTVGKGSTFHVFLPTITLAQSAVKKP
jgi:signal transduction histidine kinase